MAVTTGQINTKTTYDSFFWVYWSQQSQDIATNKTRIYWSCGVTCGHSFYSNAIKMSAVTINGEQVYGGGIYSNFSKGEHRIAYGYLDIEHNAKGEKTFEIGKFSGWLYSNYDYLSNGGSFELNTIPRAATITKVTDFTDQKNPTITYSNPAGSSAGVLQAYIYDTDDSTILAGPWGLRTDDTSSEIVLTDDWIKNLREVATGPSKEVWFYIKTVIGKGTYWSSKYRSTFSVEENADSKPKVSMQIALDNGELPDIFDGLYIQGKSRADVRLSAEGKYGANIKNYSVQADGKTYTGDSSKTDVFQGSGEISIIGKATDSRNFVGAAEQTVTVIPYAKPLVTPVGAETALLCYRGDETGKRVGNSETVFVKAKRVYYPVTAEGVQKNFCALQYRFKPVTAVWDEKDHPWKDLIPGEDTTTDEFCALIPETVFDKKKAYTVQIRVKDDIEIEEEIKTFEVPTQDVALHLGYGGKNVAVGTYCDYTEDYTFYSEWKAIFDKEVVIGGVAIMNHVIEEGTDGIWHYRKWLDGTAECRGIHVQEHVAVNIPWGNLLESSVFEVELPNGLFTQTPQFNITMVGTQGVMLEICREGTTQLSPSMSAVKPVEGTIEKLNTSIVCHGRWK